MSPSDCLKQQLTIHTLISPKQAPALWHLISISFCVLLNMISTEMLIVEVGAAAEHINPGIVLKWLIGQLLIYYPLALRPIPEVILCKLIQMKPSL